MAGLYRLFGLLAVALVVGVADALPPQKIVGGTEARPGEFPYQVELRFRGQFTCGGAIISERHILTAAHCVVSVARPYNQLRVLTGSVLSGGGQSHIVKSIHSHAQYKHFSQNSPNDIAIIVLAADIKFNSNQNKVRLPASATPTGVYATATGWGLVNANPGSTPTQRLRKVQLRTLDPAQCQRYLHTLTLYTHQICTHEAAGKGVCQGDSGGPLVYNGQLIGVVSYGIPCGIGFPDVFSSVYHYIDWIKGIMNKN